MKGPQQFPGAHIETAYVSWYHGVNGNVVIVDDEAADHDNIPADDWR